MKVAIDGLEDVHDVGVLGLDGEAVVEIGFGRLGVQGLHLLASGK